MKLILIATALLLSGISYANSPVTEAIKDKAVQAVDTIKEKAADVYKAKKGELTEKSEEQLKAEAVLKEEKENSEEL